MKIDMSPHSVTMRLKKTSELRRLCIALGGERLKEKLFQGHIQASHSTSQQSSSITLNLQSTQDPC